MMITFLFQFEAQLLWVTHLLDINFIIYKITYLPSNRWIAQF